MMTTSRPLNLRPEAIAAIPDGEAPSALLLTAVIGPSAAPLTGASDVDRPRRLPRDLPAGAREPYLVVRTGLRPNRVDTSLARRRHPLEATDPSISQDGQR
jgi:hypothetical protein